MRDLETEVDDYEDKLGSYLLRLSGQQLSIQQSGEVTKYLHTLSDFERISDHARNIAESSAELHEKQLLLSTPALNDLAVLDRAIRKIVELTVNAFVMDDLSLAGQVEPLEEVIDFLSDEMKMRQIGRLRHGQGNILQNFVFSDLITNYERISDHCSNIALDMLRLEKGSFDTHEYQEKLLNGTNEDFNEKFEAFRKEYAL